MERGDEVLLQQRFEANAAARAPGTGAHRAPFPAAPPADAPASWSGFDGLPRPAARDEVWFGGLAVFSLLRP